VSTEPSPELICYGGLPVVGRRDLTPMDAAHARRHRGVMIRSTAIGVSMVAALAVTVIFLTDVRFLVTWYGFGVLASLRVFADLLKKHRWYPVRSIQRIRRDIEEGIVLTCEGNAQDAVIAEAQEFLSLEVLPQSALILRVNGTTIEGPRFAPRSTTAVPPPNAMLAANFVRPLPDAENVFFHRRALNEREINELDEYAPPVQVLDAALAFVAIASAAASYLLFLRGTIVTLLPTVAFFVLGAYVGWQTWRGWRERRFIAGDLEASFVVILRFRDPDGELSNPDEYLPVSHVLWTRGGAPANWRKRLRAFRES
jgi:hypothetical protein